MKKIICLALAMLFCTAYASANLYITEIMHSPVQISDSDGEWVEIYNDGTENINLNSWYLKGKPLNNYTIKSSEYLVIARELLDSDDADKESFESFWGNNNGIWDENFSAIQASMSLKEEDTINLTNGIYIDSLTYNKSFGGLNGKTIQRVSITEWKEDAPTLGYGSFSSAEKISQEVKLYLTIKNNKPEILSINLTDDSLNNGFQIMPNYGSNKLVNVEVYVNDTDGYGNIQNVSLNINNQTNHLYFVKNFSSTSATFSGNFTMSPSDLAGDYSLQIIVSDYDDETTSSVNFEYLGLISTQLNTESLSWNLSSGESALGVVQIINQGNIPVNLEISANDFISPSLNISRGYLEVFSESWQSLEEPILLSSNILPMSTEEIQFRFTTPTNARSGNYESSLLFVSMESIE